MKHNNDKSNSRRSNLTASEIKRNDKENWRNEHGHPSLTFLQALADDGTPFALEKLKAIAEDVDAQFGSSDSAEDLIGAISVSTRYNSNTTT